jgi:hypothetical protein
MHILVVVPVCPSPQVGLAWFVCFTRGTVVRQLHGTNPQVRLSCLKVITHFSDITDSSRQRTFDDWYILLCHLCILKMSAAEQRRTRKKKDKH